MRLTNKKDIICIFKQCIQQSWVKYLKKQHKKEDLKTLQVYEEGFTEKEIKQVVRNLKNNKALAVNELSRSAEIKYLQK